MPTKMDYIVVVDLEATCWVSRGEGHSEIIEVGVCKLDHSGRIMQPRSLYVWPLRDSTELSRYCTELTGITTTTLKQQGMPFEGVVNILVMDYGTKNRIIATWGDYDKIEVYNQCKNMGLSSPFGPTHLNVKNLHAWLRHTRPKGLSAALKLEGLKFEGTPHSGKDDAVNTARLLHHILQERYVDDIG